MISSPSTSATFAAGSLLLLCLVLGGGHLALAQKEGNAKTMVILRFVGFNARTFLQFRPRPPLSACAGRARASRTPT
ncbi:uncharacterized protein LOC6053780 [Culex quinquefasciatus]|uniref:uncharacterized protein LOC6053780 n=1 Tax=Culex quinquefasciatus TaxID=7176 RepID=UPI0018E35A18|nr:uncharacterized protein LOC6053780 [Culex quinquefasciatus]